MPAQPQTGFKSDFFGDQYVYFENVNTISTAYGIKKSTGHVVLAVSATFGASLSQSVVALDIDPGTNGNLTLRPNGSGAVVINNGDSAGSLKITGFTSAGVVTNNASGVLASSNGTNGQVLIGGGSAPAWANLTAGSGISIANAANSITISSTGAGFAWNNVTGTSASMAVGNGYSANNAGLVTLTLPVTAAFGTAIAVTGVRGQGGWTIAQNSGQSIAFGTQVTTTGVGGSLSSTNATDSIYLVCVNANTQWNVISSIGNITFV